MIALPMNPASATTAPEPNPSSVLRKNDGKSAPFPEAHGVLATRVARRLVRAQLSFDIDFAALAQANRPGRPCRTPVEIAFATPRYDPTASADPTGEVSM